MLKYLDSAEFKGREDAEDTQSSTKLLQAIIKNGYITDGSQEGSIKTGYNEITKRYYRIEERAYVTGFMKDAQAKEFVSLLNTYSDKVAYIARIDSSKAFEESFYKNASATPSIPVTVQGSSPTKTTITKLEPFTHVITVFPEKIMDFERKQIHLNKAEHAAYVICFDPKYGRKAASKNGLYGDILKALSK